ncbi:centrosome microtubule-binding domain of Cep57-domain-containing protein [Rhexocercosporidium sp. MPI-PUGE-AT-0058]|nr:centrosome microtubule-binding domain of Cep57-domain-containing protein [Rhexocercosporidium sp. MPI-PUGE-AT-0058]
MSTSDARQRRSRLIAEMSRSIKLNDMSIASSLKRCSNDRSFASSTGSKHGSISSASSSKHGTVSQDSTRSTEFDPERDEALVSTQRMDFDVSQKLPQIRDTARKYGRWAPRKQDDFKINTSAIGRAFPDFTQGDTELSLSIEQPRPYNSTKQSIDESPLATVTNGMRLRGSPRKPRPTSPILDALHRKEDKENIAPPSQKSAGSAYVSQASRTNTHRDPYDSVDNDTFSTLPQPSPLKYQAQVDTDVTASSFSDGSVFISPAKPNSSQPLSSKTPTAMPNPSQAAHLVHASKPVQIARPAQSTKPTPAASSSKAPNLNPAPSSSQAANPTQGSFIIPQPTVSEEVATVTKPFVQHGKVLTRRGRQRPVDGFEKDQTEENIFKMIDMLKGKVADLEMINKSTKETISELQKDNDQLLSEKKQLEAANEEAQIAIKSLQQKADDHDLVHGINSQAQRIIANLQEKVADHEAIYTESQKMIQEIQEANQQLAQENELIAKEHEQISQENEQVLEQNQQLAKENENLGKENKLLIKESEKLVKENKHLVKESENLVKENVKLAKENESLSTTNTEAHDTITGLKKNMNQQDEMFTEKVLNLEKDLEKLAREPHRMGRRIPSNDADATMRPAQDPMEALNEIIGRAEEKLANMKEKLRELQDAYIKHDPAQGRRARKALREQIDIVVKEIDHKADRIYQLYDVKEGLAFY